MTPRFLTHALPLAILASIPVHALWAGLLWRWVGW